MNSPDIWIRLCAAPGLGAVKVAKLVAKVGAKQLAAADQSELATYGLSTTQTKVVSDHNHPSVVSALEWQQASTEHHIITLDSVHYPPLLAQAPAAPPVLYVKGDLDTLKQPQIAIVGSRNASPDGLDNAYHFAHHLAKSGFTITSGLALGIDGRAHKGALDAQGTTVAALGCGLNRLYPAKHKRLSQQVAENGALVSELPPDTPPRADFFPRRNRIISGLSAGVLVIEAAQKSGSLITARYALEQGREVFALPGSIHNPNARGCNDLIRDGASLIQCSQQLLEEVESLVTWSISQQTSIFEVEDDVQELPFPQLMANVGFEPTPVDILAQRTHIPVHEVMMQLLELELDGHVAAVPGGYIRKGRG
ncbi:DNA-processing protein DprA [Vibrio sp. SCSIO 43136]|uniref:DNA-processing protein DprA n=1 Tax=Vibrio sp. SCSIO 43136 TaxID=2819101 RepID=UPI0020765EB7|nr:DNA-processing protein DprA [Vibrio sp. SCSIO 43136]USD65330.1 DNA-processing protein DprA [Vibrio sp. SCSIO 43136]